MRATTSFLLFSAACWRKSLSFAPLVNAGGGRILLQKQTQRPQDQILARFASQQQSTTSETSTTTATSHDEATKKKLEHFEEHSALEDDMLTLPRHSNEGVNEILENAEEVIWALHEHSKSMAGYEDEEKLAKWQRKHDEKIYANTYVDMAKVGVVGFDYDYTLVTYTESLLHLIYDKALQRLVNDRQYPAEMLEAGLKFDPFFSIRGLAVDQETGWICHLSYTHKVSVAWEGREKLPTSRIYQEYRGKRALRPQERRKRLKPLNDLFSMAECCLIADTIQFLKDRDIPYCPMNAATDVLSAIRETHISGEFHRLVAENPEEYFLPAPHLKDVLTNLKEAGKGLIFVR